MRLIDAENFSKAMKDYFTDMITHHKYNVYCVDCNADLQRLLDEQPTAYDVDKVADELEEQKHMIALDGDDADLYKEAINDAIEIVKQGGVADDVCEWKSDYGFISDKYKIETGCGHTFYDLHHAAPFKYCPYCGKKIKVVE